MLTEKQKNQKPNQRNKPWALYRLIAYLLLAVVLIAGTIYMVSRQKSQPSAQVQTANDPTLGPATAKVVLVEYGDFGCTTCKAWFNSGVLDQIRNTYGDKVQFVWKDFPIVTAQSLQAAEAAQCAFNQGKFWEYHDMLYAKAPALSINNLKGYAAQLGLDTVEFNQCLDSGQTTAKVKQSLYDAQHVYRFLGTPSFLLNGKTLIGAQSFETLKTMIDNILATN